MDARKIKTRNEIIMFEKYGNLRENCSSLWQLRKEVFVSMDNYLRSINLDGHSEEISQWTLKEKSIGLDGRLREKYVSRGTLTREVAEMDIREKC